MCPRVAMSRHLDRYSEFSTHHADTAFIFRMNALTPISLVFDAFVDLLKLDATNEHFAIAVAICVRVDPEWH